MDDDNNFGYMRYLNDMYILHKVCEYFQPCNVLEIGFFMGQTFGIIYEACPTTTHLTSVDINYKHKGTFDKLFPDQNRMTFVHQDSKDISFDPNSFDFVMVDGDHSYEYASNDIEKAFQCIQQNGILAVDDWIMEGVEKAIITQIINKTDWVPFLYADSVLYFHHPSHDASYFLDEWLHQCREFVKLHNITLKLGNSEFTVLKSFIRYESINDFLSILKQYNI